MTSFFEGFHSHMPFVHAPTWRVSEHSLEFVLGIAAIGAQYCFEHRMSERLFRAGRAVLMQRLAREADRFGPKTGSLLHLHGLSPGARESGPTVQKDWGPWEPIEAVRALIALMGYATWEPSPQLVQEAFALQALLAQVLREIGLREEDLPRSTTDDNEDDHAPGAAAPQEGEDDDEKAWRAWVARESARRARLVAFSFMHTHSIAYDVYPVLRSSEVGLRLPSSTGEWKAQTARRWREESRREAGRRQLLFRDALSMLLREGSGGVAGGAAPLDPIPTPLGNYMLLHGLLQRIYIVRDLSLPVMDGSASLPGEEVDKLE